MVVATAGDFQDPTHQRDRIVISVFLNELISHRWLRVKMVTAFFRISFSICACFNSFFSRATSSSRSFLCPLPGKAWSGSVRYSLRYWFRLLWLTPNCSASSSTGLSLLYDSLAASILNSRVYVRRVLICLPPFWFLLSLLPYLTVHQNGACSIVGDHHREYSKDSILAKLCVIYVPFTLMIYNIYSWRS